MPEIPNKIWLFRMIHYQNLQYILQNGLCCANHALKDPDYIPIGDSSLIQARNICDVPIIPPNGNLSEYVPFYFAGHSPMLYMIMKGYKNVTKYPQKDIIYLVFNVQDVINSGVEWCFTDGHAKANITKYFNDLNDLNQIDWEIIKSKSWENTEKDPDRKRKKACEFLVKNFLPISLLKGIIVFDKNTENIVQNVLNIVNLPIKIYIDSKKEYYY